MAGSGILTDKIMQMQLSVKLAEAFPEMKSCLDLGDEDFSELTGIDLEKIHQISNREYIPTWSEYMSLIFLFDSNDRSRTLVESKGLFPDELKEVMATNRKAHN